MITIRKATAQDNTSQILQLIYDTDTYIYPALMPQGSEHAQHILHQDNMYNLNNITVAVDGGIVVGILISFDNSALPPCTHCIQLDEHYALLRQSIPDGVIHINDVSVSPQFRGQGIATQLIQHVMESDNTSYELDCLVDNANAMRLYNKLGFVTTEIVPAFTLDNNIDLLVARMVKKAE